MKRSLLFAIVTALVVACNPSLTSQRSQSKEIKVADRGYDYAIADEVSQSSSTVAVNEENPSNLTLTDLIRKTSGVSVMGNGSTAKIRISGISSFQSSDPLFVLNGMSVGTDYSHVYSLINPNDVQAITVLKGNDAAIYGSRGGFGVIVIRTN